MQELFFLDFTKFNTFTIFIRLLFALISGTLIGIDRGLKRRGAGIKTHVLVCMSSTLVMLTSEFIFQNLNANLDISRLGAQVISGVGFLGVGTIIVTGKNQVRGLTTAAGLWACACIGLAIGIGFLNGALIMLVLVLLTFKVLVKVDNYVYYHSKIINLYVEFDTIRNSSSLAKELRKQNIRISNYEISRSRMDNYGITAFITLEMKSFHLREEVLEFIRDYSGVEFVEEF